MLLATLSWHAHLGTTSIRMVPCRQQDARAILSSSVLGALYVNEKKRDEMAEKLQARSWFSSSTSAHTPINTPYVPVPAIVPAIRRQDYSNRREELRNLANVSNCHFSRRSSSLYPCLRSVWSMSVVKQQPRRMVR